MPDYRNMTDAELNARLADPVLLDRVLAALDIAEAVPPYAEADREEWDRLNDGDRFE